MTVKKTAQLISCLIAAVAGISSFVTQAAEQPFAIAIHGGAGTISKANLSPEQEKAYRAKLAEAVNAGYSVMEKGGSSEQAVITAIQILEDSTFFNAGRGAVYTWEGHHELDASVMDGRTMNAGAVAGVKMIKSPIQAAQYVMERSAHVMLSGAGAEKFAQKQGLELVDNSFFDTPHRFKALQKAKQNIRDTSAFRYEDTDYKYGTVGAVAVDKMGNLFAGTSTGGMTAKRYGRIGDSPIIGSGTWAENQSCAVSATGHGEYFIRYQAASDICARVKYKGDSIEKAGHDVIHNVLMPAGGSGGVIIIDAEGNISMPFNTEGMYRAKRHWKKKAEVFIYKE